MILSGATTVLRPNGEDVDGVVVLFVQRKNAKI